MKEMETGREVKEALVQEQNAVHLVSVGPDRASVFRLGQDPFVDPNGARMEEIIAAMRTCPSGALSYAIGGIERRDEVDQVRQPTITVSKDGPYRITCGIPLNDGQGNNEQRAQGSSLRWLSCSCLLTHALSSTLYNLGERTGHEDLLR